MAVNKHLEKITWYWFNEQAKNCCEDIQNFDQKKFADLDSLLYRYVFPIEHEQIGQLSVVGGMKIDTKEPRALRQLLTTCPNDKLLASGEYHAIRKLGIFRDDDNSYDDGRFLPVFGLYEYQIHNNSVFSYVTKLYGSNLKQAIEDGTKEFPIEDISVMMQRLVDAVRVMNELGFHHGNILPENVLLPCSSDIKHCVLTEINVFYSTKKVGDTIYSLLPSTTRRAYQSLPTCKLIKSWIDVAYILERGYNPLFDIANRTAERMEKGKKVSNKLNAKLVDYNSLGCILYYVLARQDLIDSASCELHGNYAPDHEDLIWCEDCNNILILQMKQESTDPRLQLIINLRRQRNIGEAGDLIKVLLTSNQSPEEIAQHPFLLLYQAQHSPRVKQVIDVKVNSSNESFCGARTDDYLDEYPPARTEQPSTSNKKESSCQNTADKVINKVWSYWLKQQVEQCSANLSGLEEICFGTVDDLRRKYHFNQNKLNIRLSAVQGYRKNGRQLRSLFEFNVRHPHAFQLAAGEFHAIRTLGMFRDDTDEPDLKSTMFMPIYGAYEYELDDGSPMYSYVTKYYPLNLRQAIKENYTVFPMEQIKDMMRRMIDAVVYMNRYGIQHGNIISDNIHLREPSSLYHCVLTDLNVLNTLPTGEMFGPMRIYCSYLPRVERRAYQCLEICNLIASWCDFAEGHVGREISDEEIVQQTQEATKHDVKLVDDFGLGCCMWLALSLSDLFDDTPCVRHASYDHDDVNVKWCKDCNQKLIDQITDGGLQDKCYHFRRSLPKSELDAASNAVYNFIHHHMPYHMMIQNPFFRQKLVTEMEPDLVELGNDSDEESSTLQRESPSAGDSSTGRSSLGRPRSAGQSSPIRPHPSGQGSPGRPHPSGQGFPDRPHSPEQGSPGRSHSFGHGSPDRPHSPDQCSAGRLRSSGQDFSPERPLSFRQGSPGRPHLSAQTSPGRPRLSAQTSPGRPYSPERDFAGRPHSPDQGPLGTLNSPAQGFSDRLHSPRQAYPGKPHSPEQGSPDRLCSSEEDSSSDRPPSSRQGFTGRPHSPEQRSPDRLCSSEQESSPDRPPSSKQGFTGIPNSPKQGSPDRLCSSEEDSFSDRPPSSRHGFTGRPHSPKQHSPDRLCSSEQDSPPDRLPSSGHGFTGRPHSSEQGSPDRLYSSEQESYPDRPPSSRQGFTGRPHSNEQGSPDRLYPSERDTSPDRPPSSRQGFPGRPHSPEQCPPDRLYLSEQGFTSRPHTPEHGSHDRPNSSKSKGEQEVVEVRIPLSDYSAPGRQKRPKSKGEQKVVEVRIPLSDYSTPGRQKRPRTKVVTPCSYFSQQEIIMAGCLSQKTGLILTRAGPTKIVKGPTGSAETLTEIGLALVHRNGMELKACLNYADRTEGKCSPTTGAIQAAGSSTVGMRLDSTSVSPTGYQTKRDNMRARQC